MGFPRGFEPEPMQQTGGLRWVQRFCCVTISMGVLFADEPNNHGATVKVFHYDDLESLKAHVLAFVTAYNFAKHLKGLRWRTPYQAICDAWTNDLSIFKINPHHLIPGPHS